MANDVRGLPVFAVGEHIYFMLQGQWESGTVVTFNVDDPSLFVNLWRPGLLWPIGRFCVGRTELRRGPLSVGDFATTLCEDGERVLRQYEWGRYAKRWYEPINSEHIRGMIRSIRRDYRGIKVDSLLERLFALAVAAGIDVPPKL